MPFFQVDDQLPVNPKTRKLVARTLAKDPTGLAALGLWTLAGSSSQASLTDGVVSLADLVSVALSVPVIEELADLLVAAGFWHGSGHGCEACDPVPDGSWRFHGWWDMRYGSREKVKTTRAKRQELQRPEVVNAVWARDCLNPAQPNLAACRYCGKHVNRKNTRCADADRATVDHVDPNQAKGVRNLVVACKGCNSRKLNKTPAQAEMTLRRAPRADVEDPLSPTAATPAAGTATVSPGAAAADAGSARVSPGAVDAGTATASPTNAPDAGTPAPPSAAVEQSDQTSPVPTSGPDQAETSWYSRSERTPRARDVRGAGSGSGVGVGSGEGLTPGSSSGDGQGSRRRKRRRGRGGGSRAQARPPVPGSPSSTDRTSEPSWDAGPSEVIEPARFGSPWHGWRGPRSPLGDENRCPAHGLPEPCRRCDDELSEMEASR